MNFEHEELRLQLQEIMRETDREAEKLAAAVDAYCEAFFAGLLDEAEAEQLDE